MYGKGDNPFKSVYTNDGEQLSKYVTCFDSDYSSSQNVYNDISENMEDLIENAISNKVSAWFLTVLVFEIL